MVNLSIILNAESIKRRELMSTCRIIAEQTRQEKGCLDFCLMLEFDNENIIHIEQRWKHRSFMEDHLRSDLFSALIGAIQVLSQSYEIRINESSRTEGMEAVQAAQAKREGRYKPDSGN